MRSCAVAQLRNFNTCRCATSESYAIVHAENSSLLCCAVRFMETKTESSSAATLPTVAYVSNPLFCLYRPLRLFLVLFCCSVTAHLIVQNVAATTLNTELARLQQNLAKSMFEHVAWRQQMAMEARRVGSRPDLLALLASGCRDGEQKWQALLVEQQRAIVEVAKAQAYGNGIRDAIIATHGLTGPNMGFSHMYQPSNSRLPSIVAASKNATVLGRNLPPPPCSIIIVGDRGGKSCPEQAQPQTFRAAIRLHKTK